MESVLMSVHHKHILNMHNGTKTNELRTKPPKLECPFKVYNLDTVSSGGCGKIVSEWICDSMTTWLIYMGVPAHLITTGCVSVDEILKYTNNGGKDLTAMHISNLVIYDKPKELSEFKKAGFMIEEDWLAALYPNTHCHYEAWAKKFDITRPPQSWCYVEEQKNDLS